MIGVYPGSFDPPTIAHLAIAEAAVRHAGLERLDFALSRVALGKDDASDVATRTAALQRLVMGRAELGVVVTDAQLIVDVARGYDVVVMGADKWTQVNDPSWYASADARDQALASLPRVLVAPRHGHTASGAEILEIGEHLAVVSSTAARAGADHWIAQPEHEGPESPRPRRVIVDAMNVIGSRPNGWWRDRAGRVATAAARIATAGAIGPGSDRGGVRRPPAPRLPRRRARRAYSWLTPRRGGRDAADDRIVEEVAKDADPASLVVITSDRELRARVEELGARSESVSGILSALEPESP